jgi:hypothetical protein
VSRLTGKIGECERSKIGRLDPQWAAQHQDRPNDRQLVLHIARGDIWIDSPYQELTPPLLREGIGPRPLDRSLSKGEHFGENRRDVAVTDFNVVRSPFRGNTTGRGHHQASG